MQKQIDIILAGTTGDSKRIISMIKKEISALKKSTRFIDYYESNHFADCLDKLRLHIMNDLMSASPIHAAELMTNFINLHESILNRVDDSNGEISGIFVFSCSDLGKIYEHIPCKTEEVVDLVFSKFMTNEFGIQDNIIHDFKSALKPEGLKILQNKIENALNTRNSTEVKLGLEAIADCQKDVDAFIRACSFIGKPSVHDHLEIARRLIDAWRSEEAQNERISWFENSLSSDVYSQILNYAKGEFKEDFKKKSIAKAFNHFHPHSGLSFLTNIQEFDEVAKFVRLRIGELSGREYHTLRPVADLLRDIDPLAATLVYRKLIEPILKEAKSKYYNYASKDLLMCEVLSAKIKDLHNFQDHESYYKIA
jgi:hypothetical protein